MNPEMVYVICHISGISWEVQMVYGILTWYIYSCTQKIRL
jgi:hypothetical protein